MRRPALPSQRCAASCLRPLLVRGGGRGTAEACEAERVAELVGDGVLEADLAYQRVDGLLPAPALLHHHLGQVDSTPRIARRVVKVDQHAMRPDLPVVGVARALKVREQRDRAAELRQLARLDGVEPLVA